MSKSDVIAHKPEGYGVKERQTPPGVLFEKAEDGQSYLHATFELNEQGVVKVMNLSQRFFGAEQMPQDQFAEAISKNYRIGRLSCERKRTGTNIDRLPHYETECNGLSSNGEAITISEGWLTVEQTKARPSFD
ncbi:hypothetical protein BDS110ZK25_52670 [Bradyrhizobium diazoefficiens]|uniref:Uncharacterized protein n=2 Tax=Nitrobacteraceae TaxID=41294 RepID=A0A810B3B4_9BRAD|nr:hypothetical protein XF2B_09080 [Bradyrhizobium diazoefficiens]BCE70832.1 hypothetical protein XF8B_09430 [Bradyrhizobium diazoefficiens]